MVNNDIMEKISNRTCTRDDLLTVQTPKFALYVLLMIAVVIMVVVGMEVIMVIFEDFVLSRPYKIYTI